MPGSELKIDHLSLDELLSLRELVEVKIQKIAAQEMDGLRSRIAQLEPYLSGSSPRKGQRGKARAKYRDPVSGASWSGRGRTPLWLTDYEKAGKKRASFEISQA
jgi:DNA-binding protein H-NS